MYPYVCLFFTDIGRLEFVSLEGADEKFNRLLKSFIEAKRSNVFSPKPGKYCRECLAREKCSFYIDRQNRLIKNHYEKKQ